MQLPGIGKIRNNAKKAESGARKAVLRTGSAVLVAVSLLAALAFDSPADIIEDQTDMHYNKAPVVLDADEYVNAETDDGDEEDEDQQKSTKSGVLARLRQAVLSLPVSARILIITPMWLLGTVLMTLASFLFSSPIGAFIASLAVSLAVLLGLFTATAKILFPDVPLKDILSKRNILMIAAGALVLSGIDAAAPLFWKEYPAVSFLVKLVLGGSLIGVLSLRVRALLNNKLV